MSQTVITLAFEQYKAQQEAIASPVVLDEFVLANVPNQDVSLPIDRNEGLPPQAQIVLVGDVSQAGYVNPNAVVYSLLMDTTIGDFDFNWIGLRNKASGVIAAISHIPTVHKLKTVLGVQNGNSVTRSIMMSYSDAKGLTNIDVDASTWQIDFTARLFGIDEAERLANIDVFGQAAFLSDGFKVEKSGSHYIAKAGRGYVGGLPCQLDSDLTLTNISNSKGIYLDASWQGQLTSEWQTVFSIKASNTVLVDYVDGHGYQHYVTKIADVDASGNVIDVRHVEGFAEYYQQFAVDDLLDKKIDKASITDSVTSASSILVASAKGLKNAFDKAVSAYNLANSKWTHRAASTSQTGTSQLSDSVTSTSSTLSATAKAVKTAYDKGVAAYNLAASKMTQATGDQLYANKAAFDLSGWGRLILRFEGDLDTILVNRILPVKASKCINIPPGVSDGTLVCEMWDSLIWGTHTFTDFHSGRRYSRNIRSGVWTSWTDVMSPSGTPLPWPKSSVPSGFFECRGQTFNKTTFPQLAVAYPSGQLPDLRGEFIRGYDNGRGVDSGRSVGSNQSDQIQNITGSLASSQNLRNRELSKVSGAISSSYDASIGRSTESSNVHENNEDNSWDFDASRVVRAGTETRPRNIAFMYIVRAA